MDLKNIHSIFFLGIGGIGMSALARFFHSQGIKVSGYDKTPTALTRSLQDQGMHIFFQDDPALIPQGCQMVVYTPAVPATARLFRALQASALPMHKRAFVLGMISRDIPTIAVAGTHGKTTISTMIAHMLKTAGVPFNAFLGGISSNYQTNFLASDNPQWMVAEADEFDRSFLHLSPRLAIISSMDTDHLDIYGSPEAMLEAFSLFAQKIQPGGTLILKHGLPLPKDYMGRVISYHHLQKTAGLYAENTRVTENKYSADIRGMLNLDTLQIGLPGRHNLENALAAMAVGHLLKIPGNTIAQAMKTFRGVKRRFETIFQGKQAVYIDDYAHHPEELQASIGAARELYPGRKITGIFQPHLFSRTRDLAAGFAESLALLDELWLMDIYPAREEPIPGITSQWLLDKVSLKNKALLSAEAILEKVSQKPPEVLLTLGAGDIDLLVDPLKQILSTKFQ